MRVGLGGTVPVRGQGIREIDRQLMYSAAWLDDGRPDLVWLAGGVGGAVPCRTPRRRASTRGSQENGTPARLTDISGL